MRYKHALIFRVLCLLILASASAVVAVNRYVHPGASGCSTPTDTDYAPGTGTCGAGSDVVYDTIQGCADATVAGDTCFIRAGTYTFTPSAPGETAVAITTSGTVGNTITYKAYTGETVVLQGGGYEDGDVSPVDGNADGPTHANQILIDIVADYIVVEDLTLTQSTRRGLNAVGDNNTFRNLLIDANWQEGLEIQGSDNLVEYVESRFNRHASGLYFAPTSHDNTVRASYFWRNGYEEDCHAGGGICKVLPIGGDPAGGGNSDGLAFRNTCHNSAPAGENYCLRNIVKDSIAYGNADDGFDINACHSLIVGNISLDNGPEGNMGFKIQVDISCGGTLPAAQFVENVAYFNDDRGFDPRQGGGVPSRFLHNTIISNTGRGLHINDNIYAALVNNLATNNTSNDIFITGNCAAADECTTNWAEDGGALVTYSGTPDLVSLTPLQVGGVIAFTIPASKTTIAARVAWVQTQIAAAFVATAGGNTLDTGTVDTWTNPQTTATGAHAVSGTAPDVGAYERDLTIILRGGTLRGGSLGL